MENILEDDRKRNVIITGIIATLISIIGILDILLRRVFENSPESVKIITIMMSYIIIISIIVYMMYKTIMILIELISGAILIWMGKRNQ